MPDEVVTIVITGNSASAVKAAEAAAVSMKGVGAAAAESATAAQVASRKMISAGNAMTAFGRSWTRNVSLPLIGVGAITGKMAVDFDKAMRNVNSIAQLPEKSFERLNKQVLKMAGPVAQAPKTLAEGLYDLVSSGFDAKESMVVLEASARAATAGLTTTEVSTKAVAAVLNAYRRPASDARAVSDDLFQTVNLGVVSFDELANNIGGVLPAAAAMKVDLKEVGAAISTLTKEGQSGANASVNLNAALTALIKPSEGMSAALKELGAESAVSLIETKGFQGALEALMGATDGTQESVANLFPNVRAMRAAFGLTGINAKSAAEDIRGFQNDTGATAKVLAEQSKSVSYQWNELKAEASALAIEVGDKLMPVFHTLLGDLGDAVRWFTDLPEGVQLTTLKIAGLAVAVGGLARVLGPSVKLMGTFVGAIGTMTASSATTVAANEAVATSYVQLSAAIRGAASAQGAYSATQSGLLVPGAAAAAPAAASTGARGAAMTMASSFAKAIPAAFAVAGVANVLTSVLDDDMKDAAFEGGGMIAGAVAGGIVGGLPGALIGAGIGSFGGELVGSLFGGEDGRAKAWREDTEAAINAAINGRKNLVRSSEQVETAERRLERTGHRQKVVADQVREAQKRLNAARAAGETGRVRREEARLNELKARQVRLTNQQNQQEGLLHSARVKNQQDARRARTTEVAIVRVREQQLEQARQQERVAQRAFQQSVNANKPLKEQNERLRELGEAQKRRAAATQRVTAAEKDLGGTMKDITSKFGEKFADQLRKQIPLWRSTAGQIKAGREAMRLMAPSVVTLDELIKKFGERGKDSSEKTRRGLVTVKREQEDLKASAARNMPAAAQQYTDFAATGQTGLVQLGGSFNSFLEAFKQKPVDFSVTASSGQKKAEGGFFVGGSDRRDHVHAILGGQEAVANVHQQPYINLGLGVTKAMGMQPFGDLGELFAGVTRPNNFAAGGFADKIPRQVMAPPTALTPGGQKGLDMSRDAGLKYLAKHAGGDRSLRSLIRNANLIDSRHFPYSWGGGHQSSPAPWLVPYDCSGAVSALAQHSGWDIPTMVSGSMMSIGSPGPGQFTIMANPEHVYAIIGGRAWGTSSENPGGGAGWIDGYTFRSGFAVRHLPTITEGGADAGRIPASGGGGRGQKASKKAARGGFLGALPIMRFAKGGRGMWKGIDKTYPKSDGTTGAVLPFEVAAALGEWAGLPGISMAQIGKSENRLHPGTDVPDPPGRSFGWLALHQQSNPGITSAWARNPVNAVLQAKKIVGGGLPNNSIWHADQFVTGYDLHFPESKIKAVAEGASAGGGGDGEIPAKVPVTVPVGKTGASGGTSVSPVEMKLSTDKVDVDGSLPDSIAGCRRELDKRRHELSRYRKGYAQYKTKNPEVGRAFLANINALTNRIEALRRQLYKLLRARHIKQMQARLSHQAEFKKKNDFLLGMQAEWERRTEKADQTVALEPTEGAAATDYINNLESPLYMGILAHEGNWRNQIIAAQAFAGGRISDWQTQIGTVRDRITQIQSLKGRHPDAWVKQRGQIPFLEAQIKQLKANISKTTGETIPAWEQMLGEVQGKNAAAGHTPMDRLAFMVNAALGGPQPGKWGGYIWDTQMSIRELGLKASQASGSGSDVQAALADLEADRNRIEARRQGIEERLAGVLAGFTAEFGGRLPFVGAFADGGMVPGPVGAPGAAIVHGGETILPVGSAFNIHLSGDLARIVQASAPGLAKQSDQWIGRRTRRLSFAPGGGR